MTDKLVRENTELAFQNADKPHYEMIITDVAGNLQFWFVHLSKVIL